MVMTADKVEERLPKRRVRKPRFTVDLSTRLDEKIERIAAEHGEPKSEVIRRAVEHFVRCLEYKDKGYETVAMKEFPDGKTRLVEL